MPNLYDLSDKAITLLNRRAIKRFSETRSRLGLLHFDELNVIRQVKELYNALDKDNREVFLDLAKMVYKRTEPHGSKEPDEAWLAAFLEEYNPVTKYQYTSEVDRKRDYTAEAVIAAAEKGAEFQRALKYWSRFTATYADLVTDESVIKAFEDSGVKRVRWVSEHDNRVCDTCEDRDGKVYSIDRIPPKSHVGCRCHLEAVIE